LFGNDISPWLYGQKCPVVIMAKDARPKLTEPAVVPDVWIDGIGKIEKIGPETFRFLLYRTKEPVSGQGEREYEIVLSVLTTAKAVHSMMLLARFVGWGPMLQ
jgi:hypothetical protein